jgi:hypothetical protein
MTASSLSALDWQVRLTVYRHFVAHGRPPTSAASARALGISREEARQAYRRLHQQHALFLERGTDTIRMANPLSAVPTQYRVYSNGRRLWANCAWDSLGIPAMLHADAHIQAVYAYSGERTTYAVVAGQLKADGGIVHFPLPFRRWYDDLAHT